jgi:hypothetical protein
VANRALLPALRFLQRGCYTLVGGVGRYHAIVSDNDGGGCGAVHATVYLMHHITIVQKSRRLQESSSANHNTFC